MQQAAYHKNIQRRHVKTILKRPPEKEINLVSFKGIGLLMQNYF